MSDTFLGYFLGGLGLVVFSAGILVTKVASRHISLGLGFLVATATNVVFAGVALLAQLLLRQDTLQWNGAAFWMFALAGAFTSYLGRWFFYDAVLRFGPSKASIFQVSSPLFTALMSWLFLGERLAPQMVLGMALTVGGLMLVSCKPDVFSRSPRVAGVGEEVAPVETASNAFGQWKVVRRLSQSMMVMGLGSALAYAVGNLLRGSAIRSWNEPLLGALVGAACGLLLHIVFSADKKSLWTRLRSASRSGVLLYAVIGSCTITGQILTIWSMRYIPVAIAALVTLCTPVLVFPLSHLLFKGQEKMSAAILTGSALTLVGIFMIAAR